MLLKYTAIALILAATTASTAAQPCPGDCDDNGAVTIDELVPAVEIALGSRTIDDCANADTDLSGTVEISELIAAVNSSRCGCGLACPPEPTATPTPSIDRPLDGKGDALALFDTIAADFTGLLIEGLSQLQARAYPSCPGGGTIVVDSSGMGVTLTACSVSGVVLDGTITVLEVLTSTDPPFTRLTLSGTLSVSGLFSGTVDIQTATITWADPRVCYAVTVLLNGMPTAFDVQSADQTCDQPEMCGNSVVTGGEECDDGNVVDGDGCSSMCLYEFGACGAGTPQCVVGDGFDGGSLDSQWTVDFINADGWNVNVANGDLVVSGIDANLPCNEGGNPDGWAFARLTRAFASPVNDFRLVLAGSWDSGGSSAIQRLGVVVLGSNIHCSIDDTRIDTDLAAPFCTLPGGFGSLPRVSGTGSGTFVIESCDGVVSIFFNGSPVASGTLARSATGVRLDFGYYKIDDLNTPGDLTDCVPSGPYSTFGEIRVDSVFFEAPPPASRPGSVCGF